MIIEQEFHLLQFIRLSTTSRNRLVKLEQRYPSDLEEMDKVKGEVTAQKKSINKKQYETV